MEDVLKDYAVIVEIPVAWGDMDAFGHVNNVVFYRYFEISRIAYLEKIGLWEYMDKYNVGPILKTSQCKYKVPLTYPDTVLVASRVTNLEEDRFLMEHIIYSQKLEKVVAEGSGSIVTFDYNRNCKTLVTEHVRKKIIDLENM